MERSHLSKLVEGHEGNISVKFGGNESSSLRDV